LSILSNALLVVVVIFFHLALLLPFTSNCFSGFGTKVEKAISMTRMLTLSTKAQAVGSGNLNLGQGKRKV